MNRLLNSFSYYIKTDDNKKKALMDFIKWWGEMDSNHRRLSQRIYSPPPLATRASPHKKMELMIGLEPTTC